MEIFKFVDADSSRHSNRQLLFKSKPIYLSFDYNLLLCSDGIQRKLQAKAAFCPSFNIYDRFRIHNHAGYSNVAE